MERSSTTQRRELATKTVDAAINIYIKACIWDKIPLRTVDWTAVHSEIAQKLAERGMQMGGISLKAMQMMAQRTDLPGSYRTQFSVSFEDAPNRSSDEYVRRLCDGIPQLTYDPKPFACASIAQVHHGTLNGKEVIIKIVHDGIAETYMDDIRLMAELGNKVDHYPEANGAATILTGLSEKLSQKASSEIDFEKEAENQRRVAAEMEGAMHPMRVAQILHCTSSVLVMEKLEGITGAAAFKAWESGQAMDRFPQQLRLKIYLGYAHMILANNFTQSDPHPGNLMDQGEGLALLDYGQCVSLAPEKLELWKDFLKLLPCTTGEDEHVQRAFLTIGVKLNEKDAQNTFDLLFLGRGSGIFPHIKELDQDYVPLILIMSYLSRFEKNCNELRRKVGLEEKDYDPYVVLKVFQDQIGLRDPTLPDKPQEAPKRGWFFWN